MDFFEEEKTFKKWSDMARKSFFETKIPPVVVVKAGRLVVVVVVVVGDGGE